MRPLIQVKQRETTRTDAGWFPAVLIASYEAGEALAFIIHPEQQYVSLVAKGEWEDYPASIITRLEVAQTKTEIELEAVQTEVASLRELVGGGKEFKSEPELTVSQATNRGKFTK